MNFKTRLGKRERSIISFFRNRREWQHISSSEIHYGSLWTIADCALSHPIYFGREKEGSIRKVLKRLVQKGILIKIRTDLGIKYALFPQISFNMKKLSDIAIEMDTPRRICYYWEKSNRG